MSCLVPGRTACLVCGWEKAHYEAMLREEVATQCDAFFASTVSAFPQISPLVSLAGAWLSYMAAAVLSGSGSDHEGASWRVDLRRGQAFKATVCRNAECVEPLCVEGTQNG